MDRARQLFDAAVVVEPKHGAAWHKWGILEKSQGNYQGARDLWVQVRGARDLWVQVRGVLLVDAGVWGVWGHRIGETGEGWDRSGR